MNDTKARVYIDIDKKLLIKKLLAITGEDSVVVNIKGTKECYVITDVSVKQVEGSYGHIGCEVFPDIVLTCEKHINEFELEQ